MLGATGEEISDDPADVWIVSSAAQRHEKHEGQPGHLPSDRVHGPQGQGVGPLQILHRQSDWAGRSELLEDLDDGLDDQPPLIRHVDHRRCRIDWTRTDAQKAAELGSLDIGCVLVNLQGRAQGPQRAVPLDLIAPPHEDSETELCRASERFAEQTGLADACLALHDHSPSLPASRPLNRNAQDAQLRPSADERGPMLGFDASHSATIVGPSADSKQHPLAARRRMS
jgi:hypothetical protein